MRIALSKTFDLQSAHWLPTFPEGHKCRRLHGHSFIIDVVVEGEVQDDRGYLLDYGDIKAAIAPVQQELDHRLLNDIDGLENPTAEILARWIFDRMKPQLPLLSVVRVHETCTTTAEYRGDS
tara:strand:+ start:5103 stop:5468 length:366 start_codon:yes stop_codon:yes gene_type:complete